MEQTWRDLLFAHWPISPKHLRPLVPSCLELDTFNGAGWISIPPFHMSIRLRGLLVLPGMSAIPELNFRTYVTVQNKPGVYFFSLDTASHAAVWGARMLYHLPYFHAQMRVKKDGYVIAYSSRRQNACWNGTYGPVGPVRSAAPGSLEHWLVERYCLYAVSGKHIYRGNIHHQPWRLQDASAKIEENSIARPYLPWVEYDPALISFSRELKVLVLADGSDTMKIADEFRQYWFGGYTASAIAHTTTDTITQAIVLTRRTAHVL
jgi:uncharacterized protein